MLEIKEKYIQQLIADYPWLINTNYEQVPELDNKGMEYVISDNKRIDLILRDKSSSRPVIVEFKAVPFCRENIGQVMEYKSRVIQAFSEEENELGRIFGKYALVPIMVLVVPECNIYAKIACNLSNIDVYEYSKMDKSFFDLESRVVLEQIDKELKEQDIPIDIERSLKVEEIYEYLDSLLEETDNHGQVFKWSEPKWIYYSAIYNLFINRKIFNDKEISIGIYEEMFEKESLGTVKIDFFSSDEKKLNIFRKRFLQEKGQETISSKICTINDDETEFYWTFSYKASCFFDEYKVILKDMLMKYLKVMQKIGEDD